VEPQDHGLRGHLLDAAVDLMGRAGRGGTVRVKGASMIPTLREGQLLAIEFSPRSLAVGDLLVYRQGDLLMVHRLLGPARAASGVRALRTRGDGLSRLDPRLDPSRVLGRVIALRTGAADGWRTTRTGRARLYARCVAWHDLFWAAGGFGARKLEALIGRCGVRPPLQRWVAAVDRSLLWGVHRLLFAWAHPSIPAPEEAAIEGSAEEA
jgi:hypothetical protein